MGQDDCWLRTLIRGHAEGKVIGWKSGEEENIDDCGQDTPIRVTVPSRLMLSWQICLV